MSNGFMNVEEMLGSQHGDALEATEKSYDRSLQENLRLVEELATLRGAYKDLFNINMHLTTKVELEHRRMKSVQLGLQYRMGPEALQRHIQGHTADRIIIDDPLAPHRIGFEKVEQWFRGAGKADAHKAIIEELDDNLATIERMQTEPAELPSRMVIGVAGEDLKTGDVVQSDPSTGKMFRCDSPGLGKVMSASEAGERLTVYLSGKEKVESATIGDISKTTITPLEDPVRLREIIRSERRRKKQAQGDRAVMKISLMQSQNANRKYKLRIRQLEEQLTELNHRGRG